MERDKIVTTVTLRAQLIADLAGFLQEHNELSEEQINELLTSLNHAISWWR